MFNVLILRKYHKLLFSDTQSLLEISFWSRRHVTFKLTWPQTLFKISEKIDKQSSNGKDNYYKTYQILELPWSEVQKAFILQTYLFFKMEKCVFFIENFQTFMIYIENYTNIWR